MKIETIKTIITMYEDNHLLDDISKATGYDNERCEDVIDTFDYMRREIQELNEKHTEALAIKDKMLFKQGAEMQQFYKDVAKKFVYGDYNHREIMINAQ